MCNYQKSEFLLRNRKRFVAGFCVHALWLIVIETIHTLCFEGVPILHCINTGPTLRHSSDLSWALTFPMKCQLVSSQPAIIEKEDWKRKIGNDDNDQ